MKKYIITLLIVFFSLTLKLHAITDISIKGVTLSPEFNVSTKVYNAFVSEDTQIIGINVTKLPEEIVTGSGSISLKKGLNVVEVISYINDTVTDSYTLNIVRGSFTYNKKDATLKTIKIDGIDLNFDSNIFDYTLEVPEELKELKIDYKTTSPYAVSKLKGDLFLDHKENKVTITVTSEDKKETNTYTLTFKKLIAEKVSKTKSSLFDNKNLDSFDLKLVRYALGFFYIVFLLTLFYFVFIKKKKA